MRYQDKVVLITDAASEFGQILLRRFSEEGAIPVGVDSRAITKSDVDRIVSDAVSRYGHIDVLVHNNNSIAPKSIEHCSDSEYDKSLAVNAKSAFLFTQAVGRLMKERRYGKILYVSSIHDEKPNGADFSYSVAKGAIKMLMREASIDLGIYDINVNVLSAGALLGDDQRFKNDRTPLYEQMAEMIPNKTPGTYDQLADIALFLSSDEAKMINGSDLSADGGFLQSYFPRYNYEEYEEILREKGHPEYNPDMRPENKMPKNPNSGKVAVITGSSTGIGQGVAVTLAKEGVKVVVTYNSAPPDETMRLIKRVGGDAIAVQLDVSKRQSIKDLFRTAYDAYGEIDLLVNDAAIQLNLWLLEYSEEQYDRMMQVNLKGYFMCIQEALPYIRKNAYSRILNVASIHAERPTGFDLVYSMTKGGIKMLTREAAVELSKYDINVNQLDLGAIKVPTRSGNFVPKIFKTLPFENRPEGGFLSGRYGNPADVGFIVSFLLDERSQFINGTAIRADGGAMIV